MNKNVLLVQLAVVLVLASVQPLYASSPDKPQEKTQAVTEETQNTASSNLIIEDGFTGSYLASRFASRNGDIATAVRYLRDVHRRTPDNVDVARQLQGFLILSGDMDDAIKMAETIRQKSPEDPISSLLLTLQAAKRNDLVGARAVLTESFGDVTGQLWLPLVSAWLDISTQKVNAPVTIDTVDTDIGRAAAVVNYHLALINDRAGFKDAAAKNYRDAIEDIENPPSRVFAALHAFYKKNGEPEILKPVIDANADVSVLEAAENVAISSTADGIAEVLYTMGSIMLSANVNQDAVIYLRMAMYMRHDFPAAAQAMGEAYSSIQQFAKSNEAYAKIKESSPIYSSAQINIAVNLQRMGKYQEAVALLDKISQKHADAYDALVIKGDVLRSKTNLAEAVVAYTQAIGRVKEFSARHWAVFFARGAAYERMGRWQDAEKDLQQALTLQPDQPDVLNYLGYTWLTQGQNVSQAHEMIARALALKPNDPQIIDSMGWAFYLKGDYTKATKYLERAIELIPGDATVNEHLGDVYWLQGRKTEARFQWERSLTFTDDEAVKAGILKKLQEGVSAPVLAGKKPPQVAAQQLQDAPSP
ncbi:MAG: tetratricopeptide repeat protein [Alphaproteobacteria bacterium]